MRKVLLIIFILTNTFNSVAQNNSFGEIDYEFTIPQRSRILVRNAKLYFNDSISYFVHSRKIDKIIEETISKQDVSTGNIRVPVENIDDIGSFVFRSFNNKQIVARKAKSKTAKGLYLNDNWKELEWKVIDSYKKIENFKCQKAKANFRGRNYTVWFTAEIPVQYGPWKLFGLPGLILEAEDDTKEFIIKVKKITLKNELVKLDLPSPANDDTVVNFYQYQGALAKEADEFFSKFYAALPKGTIYEHHKGNPNPIELKWE